MALSKDPREMVISEVILGGWAGFPKSGLGAEDAGRGQATLQSGRVVMGLCVRLAEGGEWVLEF